MSQPVLLMDIDLTPTSGKHYFNVNREWREEFIYFL
jgi:alpha-amylase